MPVRPKPVEFPLAGGLQTKLDSKLVNPPECLDLVNVQFAKHGSWVMRTGYESLPRQVRDSTNISGLQQLGAREDELFAFNTETFFSYSPDLAEWISRGSFSPVSYETRPISDVPSSQTSVATASEGTIRVTAWSDSRGGVYAVVTDESTGVTLTEPHQLSAEGEAPIVLATGSTVLVFFMKTTSSSIFYTRYSSGNLTPVQNSHSVSDMHADHLFETKWFADKSKFVVAYKTSTGIRMFTLDNQGTFTGDTILTFATTPVNYISIAGDDEVAAFGVAYSTASSTLVRYFLWSSDVPTASGIVRTISANASVACSATLSSVDADRFTYLVEVAGSTLRDNIIYKATVDNTLALTTSDVLFLRHSRLLGHIAQIDTDKWVAYVGYSSVLQSTGFLVDQGGAIVAKFEPGQTTISAPNGRTQTLEVNGSIVRFALNDKKRLDVAEENLNDPAFAQAGVQLVTAATDSVASVKQAEFGGSTYFTGGILHQYDGSDPVEAGFHLFPEDITSDATDTGNLYTYAFYWEWFDAQGKRLQSATKLLSVTNADPGTDSVTFTIPTLAHTSKQGTRAAPQLAVYRTQSGGSATFRYRVSSFTDAPQNDPTVDSITFTDVMPDSVVASGEIDYQVSGELINQAAESSAEILSHDDRLFYVAAKNPTRVYFSKRPGQLDQPGFSAALFIDVPPNGGDITGLGVLDNKLVVFKRDRVYMVSGAGPNNLGIGAYSLPRLISTDTGCSNSDTIVRVPQGLMFQSSKGLYWVNRGEAVNYVGSPAEAYNDQNFVSAELLSDKNGVAFLTSSGSTLWFDYLLSQWSRWENHEGLSATLVGDDYYYLRTNGQNIYKADTSFTDDTSTVKFQVRTAWIKPEGQTQGFWHMRRATFLGNYLSTHDVRLEVYVNYEENPRYFVTWDPEGALNTSLWGDGDTWGGGHAWGIVDEDKPTRVYQFKHLLKYQKVQSISFRVTAVLPETGRGAAFELTTLAVEAAGYGESFKLPGSKAV